MTLTQWEPYFPSSGAIAFVLGIAQLEGLIGKKEVELSVLKNYLDFHVHPDAR